MKGLHSVIICGLLLFYILPKSYGQGKENKGNASFTSNDIFQSAVFLENLGILPDYKDQKVLYYAARDHINVAFTEKGLLYTLSTVNKKKLAEIARERKDGKPEGESEEEEGIPVKCRLVPMEWIGANPHPEIVASKREEAYHTYLKKTGNTYTTLTTWGHKTITYKNLYPFIDVEYSFPEKGGLEYTLIVHPGGDASQVKFKYLGKVKLKLKDGNLYIQTTIGDILEHAPVAFYAGDINVESGFSIEGQEVQFVFPTGYNHEQTLTIDPWVQALTVMPPANIGFDIDYNANGEAFVYGAGPTGAYNINEYFKIAKYGVNGTLAWVFNGTLASPYWNTSDDASYNFPSNEIVDKVTGKIYMGKGFEYNGTACVRLNNNGQYDNFISSSNLKFNEIWKFAYNCITGQVLALGGGNAGSNNIGVIDQTTGAVTNSNITGNTTYSNQDIISGTYDAYGSLYVIMNCYYSVALPYLNTIYKVNQSYNGNVWAANSGYNSFRELYNVPDYAAYPTNYSTNAFNCLAANGSFLYYYDGLHLSAYSLATGSMVGTAYTVPNHLVVRQGGIAVDLCDHVYIGGIGQILTFTFNGSTFVPGASIPLGAGFNNTKLLDVKYNSGNNSLYATGFGMAGVYPATLSTSCNTFTMAVATSNCNTVTATLTPVSGLSTPIFTYTWLDANGNVVNQTANTTSTTNTVNGLADGNYTVQATWNANCGGSAITKSFTITCSSVTLATSTDVAICAGSQTTLSATPSVAGGSYLWVPGNAVTSSITVSPAITTVYTVTYTPITGAPISRTITVTVNAIPNAGPDQNITAGATATMAAAGTGIWTASASNPAPTTFGNANSATSTIASFPVAGTYTFTWTVNGCPDDIIVTAANPVSAGADQTICLNETATMNAIGAGIWTQPNTNPTIVNIINPASATTSIIGFSIAGIYSFSWGGDVVTVTVRDKPTVNITTNNTNCTVANITAAATNGTPPYTYRWSDNSTLQSIANPNVNTIYTVTVTDLWGCTATAVVPVIALVTPTATLSQIALRCNGDNDGVAFVTAAGGTVPYTYSWSNNQTTISITGLSAASYDVTVTDANGCTVNGSVIVTEPSKVTAIATTDSVTCNGNNNGVIATIANGGTPPYQFSIGNATTQTTGNFTQLRAGNYTVSVTDANNCTATSSASIFEPLPLQVALTYDNVSCHGDSNGTILATASGGTSPYTFALNNAGSVTNSNFMDLKSGTYTILVSDANDCKQNAFATLIEPPSISVEVAPVLDTIVFGKSITLVSTFHAWDPDPAIYSWHPTEGLSCFDCPQPEATPLQTTTYTLIVKDSSGCIATAQSTIFVDDEARVLYIPNAFSPNGDGNNDVFNIYGSGIKTIELRIYDRWGEQVFVSNDINNGWDGAFQGVTLMPSVFVYQAKIIYLDDTEKDVKGSVTLMK